MGQPAGGPCLAARRSSSGPRKPGTRSAGAKRAKTTKKRSQAARPAGTGARKSSSAREPAASSSKPKKGAKAASKRSGAAKTMPGKKVSRARRNPPAGPSPAAAQRKAGRTLVGGHASPLGRVVDAFPRAKAATLALDGELRRGDLLHFRGHTTDFCQPADELRLAGERVQAVGAGQLASVAVRERVRPGDRVYRIEPGDAEQANR